MLQAAKTTQPYAQSQERRRHSRVPLALLGRYMLPNFREYPCQTVDISPGGVALTAPVPAEDRKSVV
jgi:c-di-GMP-binding flagellar brake protein YcgR